MVNKMHTLNPNVLKNQIRQIEPYCVTNRLEIDSWKSYTGMHVSPNNIVLDENPPIQMYLGDIYTISVNLAGLPGISLPCGTDSNGLPIGLQLIGDCFKEKNIIRAAYSFEQTKGYKHSPLSDKAGEISKTGAAK